MSMKAKTKRIPKNLLNDLKVQLNSISIGIKPSYLWELSIGDINHVLDSCHNLGINLSDLQLIQINDMIYIANIQSVVKHLNHLLTDSFNAFIDVSPDLSSPQLSDRHQILVNKNSLKSLLNEIKTNENKEFFEVEMKADMCLITGSLLGYPVIYINRNPLSGNCLAFEPLSHFCLQMADKIIYSFSCPQKYRHLFDSHINSWFESIKSQTNDKSLSLNETIKTMSYVLT